MFVVFVVVIHQQFFAISSNTEEIGIYFLFNLLSHVRPKEELMEKEVKAWQFFPDLIDSWLPIRQRDR